MIAIGLSGQLVYTLFEGSFNSKRCIEFFELLLARVAGPIRLVLDRLQVHRSVETNAWLSDPAHPERRRLRISLLPAYAPELNPQELVNQHLKATLLVDGPPLDKRDYHSRWRDLLDDLQAEPDFVQQFFAAEEVAYIHHPRV